MITVNSPIRAPGAEAFPPSDGFVQNENVQLPMSYPGKNGGAIISGGALIGEFTASRFN